MTVRHTITADSDGEKILKIGQHLQKLLARTKGPVSYNLRVVIYHAAVS